MVGCSMPWIMRVQKPITLMIVIQLWQTTSGADPPPMIQKTVKVFNEQTASFNWTYPVESIIRIQWIFKDSSMTSYTDTKLDLKQESLTISHNYKGRFHLLQSGDVGFSLLNVTRADIGLYRCIVTLSNGVGELLQGALAIIDRQDKLDVCSDRNASFTWTWTWGNNNPFSLIQWQFNGATFASTTEKGFSTESLEISTDYKSRFHLPNQDDVGFQLDNTSREDTGTFSCVITLQSGEFTFERDLEVKDYQSGDFRITISNQKKLTCGEGRESSYSWIFSNSTRIDTTTNELHLPSVPQTGSVYCQRHSDCTSSSPYSFSSGEVPEDGGNITAAVVAVVVVIIIIIIIVIIVLVLFRRRRNRERFSSETGRGESVREEGANML